LSRGLLCGYRALTERCCSRVGTATTMPAAATTAVLLLVAFG